MADEKSSKPKKKSNAALPAEIAATRPTSAGAPPLVDRTLIRKICESLILGLTPKLAAQYCGVHQDTFFTWIRRGKKEMSDPDSIYGELYREIEVSRARAIARAMIVIDQAMTGKAPVYEYEFITDENGKILEDKNGNPLKKIARDNNGKPIIKEFGMKPDPSLAVWKTERLAPREYGRIDRLIVDNMDAPGGREEKDVTPKTKEQRIEELLQRTKDLAIILKNSRSK